MPIQLTCPSCDRPLRLADEYIGYLVRCPGCSHEFAANVEGGGELGIRGEAEIAPRLPVPGGELIQTQEPAPRAERRRRFDDDDDEFDDIPRRRRPQENRGYALDRVSGPANGLLAVGWIGLALSACGLAGNLMGAAEGQNQADVVGSAVGIFVSLPLAIATCVLIIVGATKMKKLENFGLAKASAIIAMVPCVSPCCLLGLPFGYMAMQALGDPRVESAFRTASQSRDFDDRY